MTRVIQICLFAAIAVGCCSCATLGGAPAPAGIRHKRAAACNMADVVFVIDSSGSIGENNWQKVLNFMKGVISGMPIGRYQARFGVVSFGNKARLEFQLDEHETKEDLLAAVDRIKFKDETTNTSGGIWYMREKMFNVHPGDRPNAPNIAFIITDGVSTVDANLTRPYALEAQAQGITIVAIGIGPEINETKLREMATNRTMVYRAENFDALPLIESSIVATACDIPVDCSNNMDVIFVLDASGSVRPENFALMKNFVGRMMEHVNVDSDELTNVGLATFSDEAKVEFHLNAHNSRSALKAAVNQVHYTHGTTNTAAAMRLLREEMFQPENGDRRGLRNIAVLFTDGGSNDFSVTLEEAKLARLAGISVIVVALTKWVKKKKVPTATLR